jgi:serine phosphatase RsbU (regulator of sigma subunit)/CheY-like chemotaxis protein
VLHPSGVPILVVDDNEVKRYTACRTLQKAGFETWQAVDGTDALKLVQRGPAVVVLDVNLPDIDGFEVCRRIKSNPETARTLVLHLSAYRTTAGDQVFGLEAGADAYLAVPVEPEVFIATVRALVRLYQAEESARIAAYQWSVTFDTIRDAVCLLSPAGQILRCNSAMLILARMETEQLVGGNCASLLQNALGMTLPELTNLTENEPLPKISEVPGSDGRWFRITLQQPAVASSIAGTVCIVSEITQERLLEEANQAAYRREERIAEAFQDSLLTRFRSDAFPGFSIQPVYFPALKEAAVGGDFYDVIALDNGKVAFVVADASGKGLDAAIRTAEVKYVLRALLWEDLDPAQVMYRLNNFMCRTQENNGTDIAFAFTVLSLVVVDPATDTAMAFAAGAENPFILKTGTGEAEVATHGDLPLGIVKDTLFQGTQMSFTQGDLLLLFTDGITEARNGNEFFGYERTVSAAKKAFSASTVREAAHAIYHTALAFTDGALQDDACLLVARRL